MEIIFQKHSDNEEVFLYKTPLGDIDFRFIRKDVEGNEILNSGRVELSVYNKHAQTQLDEIFDNYKINSDLQINLDSLLNDLTHVTLARRWF